MKYQLMNKLSKGLPKGLLNKLIIAKFLVINSYDFN